MKRIFFLIIIGALVIPLKILAGTVQLSQSAVLSPTSTSVFSTSDFSVCGSGLRTFLVNYSFSSHSSCWSDRYRVTHRLFKDGVEIGSRGPSDFSITSVQFIFGFGVSPFPSGVPVSAGTYTVTSTLERRPCIGSWYTAETVLSNEIHVTNSCSTPTPPACPATITISGSYTTPLSQASSWIQSNGSTSIPIGATVRLDANNSSNSGYIILNSGFEASEGSLFIAQALDGCGVLVPMRQTLNEIITNNAPLRLSAYPNPTLGILNIQHPSDIQILNIYSIDGRLCLTSSANPSGITQINMETLAQGVYIIKAEGQIPIKIQKQ